MKQLKLSPIYLTLVLATLSIGACANVESPGLNSLGGTGSTAGVGGSAAAVPGAGGSAALVGAGGSAVGTTGGAGNLGGATNTGGAQNGTGGTDNAAYSNKVDCSLASDFATYKADTATASASDQVESTCANKTHNSGPCQDGSGDGTKYAGVNFLFQCTSGNQACLDNDPGSADWPMWTVVGICSTNIGQGGAG